MTKWTESARKSVIRHGHAGPHGYTSPTYQSWKAMKGRCLNSSNSNFLDYGGRGITICERWLTFENFLADMGEKPDGLTLDRIDNDGNYEPNNVRWATRLEQGQNKRRSGPLSVDGRLRDSIGRFTA
jgi:hypothetical protein